MRYVPYLMADVDSKLDSFKIKHSGIPKSYKLKNLGYKCEIKNSGSLGTILESIKKIQTLLKVVVNMLTLKENIR